VARADAVHRAWGEAIFELARAAGKIETFEAQLAGIAKLYEEHPALRTLAATPRVRVEVKQKFFEKAFKGQVEPLLHNMLQLAAAKRRLAELPGIARAFTKVADRHQGRARVRVTSAVALDDAARDQIARAVGDRLGKKAILEERVLPEILGGLIIEHGDLRVDGSLARRLSQYLRVAREKVRAPEAS